ncbi:MAG: hypothetical protein RR356_04515, partial [Bacteroidales bacterium]
QGAWYPDAVIKDMASSHILKYRPENKEFSKPFKQLPKTSKIFKLGKSNPLIKQAFSIEKGNLADRCESISHSIIDNFKMLHTEGKGSPITPSNHHISTLFFMLSHYIADAHMPLHCDYRGFSNGDNIHGFIESQWDYKIKKGYKIDIGNSRFYYDSNGYPLRINEDKWIDELEQELISREFIYNWGTGNGNTWDYMSAVTQYSYLMSYLMIPAQYNETNLDQKLFKNLDTWQKFDQHSQDIFVDAIDSIARIWLHVWNHYQKWAENQKNKIKEPS